MRVLDSHLHLWDPSLLEYTWLEGPLRARFGLDEIDAAVSGLDTEFVFVQAQCVPEQYLEEVAWVSDLAGAVCVRGVVAGARLDGGAATRAHLDALAAFPLVVGVRHLLQGEPDGFSGSAAFRAGMDAVAERGWTFDACVRSSQLRDVIALAEAYPDLRIVLDHLGKPFVGTAAAPARPSEEWARDLTALAAHPRVHVKLSGLPAEAAGAWSPAQVEPFLDAAAEAFGPERLMIGSDWPVSAVRGGEIDPAALRTWVEAVRAWAESRGHDVAAILHSNAERFYGLR